MDHHQPSAFIDRLAPAITDTYGIRKRLWMFLVGWIGFHAYFAILCPVLYWLPFWEEETQVLAFLAIVGTSVLFIAMLVLIIAKTSFLHPFLNQTALVALWFFLCILGAPLAGGRWIQWWQLSNMRLIEFDVAAPPKQWLPTVLYQADGFIQNKESQWKQFINRTKRNPGSNGTPDSNGTNVHRDRYWMSQLQNATDSPTVFNFFMVNTDGQYSSETYTPTLVARIENNPRHLRVYSGMARAAVSLSQGDLAKPMVYLNFFELSERLNLYWNRTILAYSLVSLIWFLACAVFFRRNQSP